MQPQRIGKGRRPRVLVVDDDADVREMLRATLAIDNDVTTAADGMEAMGLLSKVELDCLVADHMMPGFTGVQLLTAAADVQPRAVRILCTASERIDDLRDAVNVAHVHRFISKPLRVMELSNVVAD